MATEPIIAAEPTTGYALASDYYRAADELTRILIGGAHVHLGTFNRLRQALYSELYGELARDEARAIFAAHGITVGGR